MAFNPIHRHPASRRPSPVRWYLALMMISALLLGAAHFAMQVHAQKQAEDLIHTWVDPQVLSVGAVRYRMLRGALTLMDVDIKQEGWTAHIPLIELHGHLSALAADEPRLDILRIHHADVQLTDATRNFGWHLLYQHEVIARLWAAAKDVQLKNLRVQWALKDQTSESITFNHAQLQQTHAGRKLSAIGNVFGGNVHIKALEIDRQLSSGSLVWDQLNTNHIQATLPNLDMADGTLTGQLDWKSAQQGWQVNGKTHLQRKGITTSSKLTFDGKIKQGKWQAKVTSTAWPVQMLGSYLPESDTFQLASAHLDAEMQWRGHADDWRVSMKQARLHQVLVQSKANPADTWALNEIMLKGLVMRWPNQTVWMDQLQLNGGEWPIELLASTTPWKGIIQDIEWLHVKPIVLSSGVEVLRLPQMKGHGNWASKRGLSLNIRNAEIDEPGHEVWRISGNFRNTVNIRFNDVSAARFRAWLPGILRDEADALSGDVSAKLVWKYDPQASHVAGVVHISDAEVKIGSERWLLNKCRIDLAKVGSELSEQQIQSIRVKGWHYQAALKPLLVMAGDISGESTALLEPHWRIDALTMQQGTISVGREDAVWMQDVTLHIKPMQMASLANMTAAGKLNDGTFTFSSVFDPFAKGFKAETINIDIRNALPFFVGDWLQVSGMPRITRGRLYMDMSIKRHEQAGYQGKAYVRLHYGALEDGMYTHDPMLKYTGYQSQDLYARLDQGHSARLFFPLKMDALSWQGLGQSLLIELNKEVSRPHHSDAVDATNATVLSQVRLHDVQALTVNERTRLRTTIAALHSHPKWMLELQPHLGNKPLDRQMIRHIRYTQDLLTAYIVRGGISRARVLPVWPQPQHRSDQDSSSIQLIARP